jgi:hypothetical protein
MEKKPIAAVYSEPASTQFGGFIQSKKAFSTQLKHILASVIFDNK